MFTVAVTIVDALSIIDASDAPFLTTAFIQLTIEDKIILLKIRNIMRSRSLELYYCLKRFTNRSECVRPRKNGNYSRATARRFCSAHPGGHNPRCIKKGFHLFLHCTHIWNKKGVSTQGLCLRVISIVVSFTNLQFSRLVVGVTSSGFNF